VDTSRGNRLMRNRWGCFSITQSKRRGELRRQFQLSYSRFPSRRPSSLSTPRVHLCSGDRFYITRLCCRPRSGFLFIKRLRIGVSKPELQVHLHGKGLASRVRRTLANGAWNASTRFRRNKRAALPSSGSNVPVQLAQCLIVERSGIEGGSERHYKRPKSTSGSSVYNFGIWAHVLCLMSHTTAHASSLSINMIFG
jgi:hypothetical protein